MHACVTCPSASHEEGQPHEQRSRANGRLRDQGLRRAPFSKQHPCTMDYTSGSRKRRARVGIRWHSPAGLEAVAAIVLASASVTLIIAHAIMPPLLRAAGRADAVAVAAVEAALGRVALLVTLFVAAPARVAAGRALATGAKTARDAIQARLSRLPPPPAG